MALKRIRMACILLGDLSPGQWRHLTLAERSVLLDGIQTRPGENPRVLPLSANTAYPEPGKRRHLFTAPTGPKGRAHRKKNRR